jgi:hypothetical protein
MIALLAACTHPGDPAVADPTARLVRTSLDLRGVRPSEAELDRIAADPAHADQLVDEWLADARFELRVRDLFARVWRTRVDEFGTPFFDGSAYDLPDTAAFREAVGDEPLALIGRVAAEDRPYTDIVTSPTTYASAPLAKVFPITYPEGASGWQEVTYTDGRPMAGVLSTNGLWWRYLSTAQNFNRGRANALSRILLCSDFASRPVSFSRTAEADGGGEDLTRTDPTCLSCHSALDPLGSLLYGFHSADGYTPSPYYSVPDERDWVSETGVSPGFFGEPVGDLVDLGIAIASDPRFPDCAVQEVYTGLYGIEADQADPSALERHRAAFVQGGARLKALYRSIVTDPAYAESEPRFLPIESLRAAVQDVTGYQWEDGGGEVLATDDGGLRTLGGGVDGRVVTRAATAPSATTVLVQERLAELAAPYAVAHDAERADPLFAEIDFTETPETDRPAMEAEVRHLVRRTLGRAPTASETDDLLATWSDAAALSTPQDAWAAVLTVLLRDPEFVLF